MKTITFFSEKGGVGKSSFSIMYASFLQKNGVKVALADFNHRIERYRENEIKARNNYIKNNPDAGIEPLDPEKSWPVKTAWLKEIEPYKEEGITTPFASWFTDNIKNGLFAGKDVIVCDFPGSLADGSFTNLLVTKYLNLIVTPTEKDDMTLSSTLKLNKLLKDRYNHCVFINKAQLGLKNFRNSYLNLGKKMANLGIRMLPDIVTYSERMGTIDKVDLLRSTFDYSMPEELAARGLSDLGITNLFIDVTRELAKTADLPGTGVADLTFIDKIQKTNDGRSFKGSSFPEYETC